MSQKIYQILTEKIIEGIKQGKVPWQKPWSQQSRPQNFITKRPYTGFNMFALLNEEFGSKYWLTFKQVVEKGGKLKKGSKGVPIVYWLFLDKETGKPVPPNTSTSNAIPVPRYYTVFNIEQTEDISYEENEQESPLFELSLVNEFIDIYCEEEEIRFTLQGDRAFYSPSLDYIQMPVRGSFKSELHFYSTAFHEMSHSTGVKKRLDRGLDTDTFRFGDHLYSKEELVAEFSSSFLMAEFGIFDDSIFNNSVAYLQSWAKTFEDQPSMLLSAAGQAQKAANYILKKEITNEEEAA